MRLYALVTLTALTAFPVPTFAQNVEVGPGGVTIEPHQGRSVAPPDCADLRRACLRKEELGEEGEGNCRRYREACGRPE